MLSSPPSGTREKSIQYVELGHPKDYAKFHCYVVLLRNILLKHKLDLSYNYAVFGWEGIFRQFPAHSSKTTHHPIRICPGVHYKGIT